MLLLQLDMLASVGDDDALTLGAGVPAAWLASPLAVRGLSFPRRSLDWRWDGHAVEVTVRGEPPARVVLGPAFAPGTPLAVRAAP
jgi:hypothetical protein